MSKKKKKIINPEMSKQKKDLYRIPVPKPTEFHKDKSKYSRKKKYKDSYNG